MIQSGEMQEVLDHFQIRQVLERYCRGVDRLNKQLVDGVYWPEATDDHGLYVGPGSGFADWLFPAFRDAYASTMHCIAQSNIEVRGMHATSDTYFLALHRIEQGKVNSLEQAYGRYIDLLEKRSGEWRILDRKVVMEHVQVDRDVDAPPFSVDHFRKGHRNRDDISYHAFESINGGAS